MPFVILGTLILWFGWYGFNCGSTLGLVEGNVAAAGTVALNTSISAGVAGFVVLALRALVEKCSESRATYYDVSATANGILAGLVSITAGCADVEGYAAFVIGVIGAIIYVAVSQAMRSTGVDDPLDAFAIHGACGAWGVFALGLFHTGDGVFYGGDGELLGWQITGILVITLWSGVMSLLVFGILHFAGYLRVADSAENTGLDKLHHGGNAYAIKGDVELATMAKAHEDETEPQSGEENEEQEEQEEPVAASDVTTAESTAPTEDGANSV